MRQPGRRLGERTSARRLSETSSRSLGSPWTPTGDRPGVAFDGASQQQKVPCMQLLVYGSCAGYVE